MNVTRCPCYSLKKGMAWGRIVLILRSKLSTSQFSKVGLFENRIGLGMLYFHHDKVWLFRTVIFPVNSRGLD
jgi:hypothetical protein